MLIYDDPDRFETFSTSTTCSFHEANPGKVHPGCTCSGGFGKRAVSEEEYQRRRAERVRREEDDVLQRAASIQARRDAQRIEAGTDETPAEAVQPEGREPGGEAMRP